MVRWKQRLVAPQAVPTCVTETGAQWLCIVPHRCQRKALSRAKLYHVMINNQGTITVPLTLSEDGSIKQSRSCPL
jgi:hypothetical protein